MNPQSGALVFPFAIDVHLANRPFKLGFNAILRSFTPQPHFDTNNPATHKGRKWVLYRDGVAVVSGSTGGPTESLIGVALVQVDTTQTLHFEFDSDANKNSLVKVTIAGTGEFSS